MELNCNRQSVMINKVVFDGVAEQGIESDVMLADYCPDVVRILRCSVAPKIEAAVATGSKIVIDAAAQIKIYYLTEQKTIRQHYINVPFQKQCDFGEPVMGSTIVYVRPKVDYINCRAVSPRRLEIRGAISMEIKVVCALGEDAVCDGGEMGVQLKKEIVSTSQLTGQACSTFTVQETLELGYGKPPIATLLDFRTSATVGDYKAIASKVITKGELNTSLTYYCGEGKLQKMDYSIPISQIVDMEGASEESDCVVIYEVMGGMVEPRTNPDGESKNLSLECKVKCTVLGHSNQSYVHVSDCYSTMHECSCMGKKAEAAAVMQTLNAVHSYKDSISVPEGISEVCDLWCSVEDTSWEVSGAKALLTIKLSVCMIAMTTEGIPELFERTEEIVHEVPLGRAGGTVLAMPTVYAMPADYTVSGERLDIRCDIIIKGSIYKMEQRNIVKAIEVDSEHPKQVQSRPALTIYYADSGESVWEIAKRYNTVVDGIMEHNGLSAEILESRCMLLIPTV